MIPTTGHCLWEPPLTYNSYRVPLVCTIGPPLISECSTRKAALNLTPMQPTPAATYAQPDKAERNRPANIGDIRDAHASTNIQGSIH